MGVPADILKGVDSVRGPPPACFYERHCPGPNSGGAVATALHDERTSAGMFFIAQKHRRHTFSLTPHLERERNSPLLPHYNAVEVATDEVANHNAYIEKEDFQPVCHDKVCGNAEILEGVGYTMGKSTHNKEGDAKYQR